MKLKFITIIYFIITILLFTACVPQKKILYLQNESQEISLDFLDYEPILKPDDLLHIQIKSLDKESVEIFNLNANLDGNLTSAKLGFLVDKYGFIDYPVIGKIKASGFKKSKFKDDLEKELKKHLKSFTIDIRIVNYKISVLGEVAKPGEYIINSDRITLFQALALAGDLTVFGNRKNILLLREENNIKKTYRIDITNEKFIQSEQYYLRQNDEIIVDPRRGKADNVAISSNITTTLSILTTLVTIYLLTKK
jgi:polysaccharide export outer membrane protein